MIKPIKERRGTPRRNGLEQDQGRIVEKDENFGGGYVNMKEMSGGRTGPIIQRPKG